MGAGAEWARTSGPFCPLKSWGGPAIDAGRGIVEGVITPVWARCTRKGRDPVGSHELIGHEAAGGVDLLRPGLPAPGAVISHDVVRLRQQTREDVAVGVTRWTARTSCVAMRLKSKAAAELGPGVSYDEETGQLTAIFEVKAATLRQATDEALRRAHELMHAKPAEIMVQTTDRYVAMTEHPPSMDLLSVGDVAVELGVSATRVIQLWQSNSRFPEPIARPRNGPVWTRASILAFKAHRERNRASAGRPRKQKA